MIRPAVLLLCTLPFFQFTSGQLDATYQGHYDLPRHITSCWANTVCGWLDHCGIIYDRRQAGYVIMKEEKQIDLLLNSSSLRAFCESGQDHEEPFKWWAQLRIQILQVLQFSFQGSNRTSQTNQRISQHYSSRSNLTNWALKVVAWEWYT